MEPEENSIKLSTFLKFGLTEVIRHKTVQTGGKTLVNYVSALAFISGTNSVTKHPV